MNKLAKTLPRFIYLLFYFVINASIGGVLFILLLPTVLWQWVTTGIFPEYGNENTYLLYLVWFLLFILSNFIVIKVKNRVQFFVFSLCMIFFSYVVFFQFTSVVFEDYRLVLCAGLYVFWLATILTSIWSKVIIQKNTQLGLLLSIPLGISVYLFYSDNLLWKLYMNFAYTLNQIDYLFSKLRLDYLGFVVVLINFISSVVAVVLSTIKKKSL